MSNEEFTIDQIGKLREIEKARIKTGEPGLRSELQTLIARLQSGGVGVKTEDPREAQAKRLYDKGFGGECAHFAQYLASIPEIPEALKVDNDRFPELVLVDTRLPISKICELLEIEFSGNDETFVDFDSKTEKTDKVYWIRMQGGKKNDGKSIQNCRWSFTEDEVGLSAYEGLAFFAQSSKSLKGRVMDLPGSVLRDRREVAAYLGWYDGRPGLDWSRVDDGDPYSGSASRMK